MALRPDQRLYLFHRLLGKVLSTAARAAGVPPILAKKWEDDPEFTAAYDAAIDKLLTDRQTALEPLAKLALERAEEILRKGKTDRTTMDMARYILSQVYGNAPIRREVTGDPSKPIRIEIISNVPRPQLGAGQVIEGDYKEVDA